ncbi:MAG TPA: hypothetical protein VG965_01130 [Patescibacteria group bacterium]|nr:hypothetical protein [Patescibacteria group bacterium]
MTKLPNLLKKIFESPSHLISIFAVLFLFIMFAGNVAAQVPDSGNDGPGFQVSAPTATPTPQKVVVTQLNQNAAATPTPTPATTSSSDSTSDSTTDAAPQWQQDAEVSFVGKTASRSGDFLDWTLQNYNWLCVKKTSINTCDNANDPLISFWIIIRNIVYAFIALFVLATAFILIVTRGQNITIMRFIPRFVVIVILITLSFSLVQFIYQIFDVVQDFFLKVSGNYISTRDLLFIGFDYKNFVGYRLVDAQGTYDESAFISLLLVRLTAITYYVMTGILLVRKIILWFFIIISPILPLLLFYKPIRNTAKIWVGEFFRWLLYAPLFAIFLHGLVIVWQKGIPLPFDFSGALAGDVVYPTAVNILLGGPGQAIGITNSVNLRDTFAEYVVALLMLWVVILLPFLLLKIFLDYISTISLGNNLSFKQLIPPAPGFFTAGSKGTPPNQPPGLFSPEGRAKTLPFLSGRRAAAPVQYQSSVQGAVVRESTDVMRLANLSIPRMRDIAQYETSMISNKASGQMQASAFSSSLQKIANPTSVASVQEREKFSTVRQKLLDQKQKGNPIAASVIAASAASVGHSTSSIGAQTQQMEHVNKSLNLIANPALATNPADRDKAEQLKQELQTRKEQGDKLASSILEAQEQLKTATGDQKEKMEKKILDDLLEAEKTGNKLAKDILPANAESAPKESLPMVNHVQQVSLEDYEEVRKLWTENYQTIEPPKALNGEQVNRREWISNDIEKINQAITLLSGVDPARVSEGMSMVSNILPFLLVGGFSKNEVVSYLKAKMEAGKQVLADMSKKEEDEASLVSAAKQTIQKPQELKMEVEPKEIPEDEKTPQEVPNK